MARKLLLTSSLYDGEIEFIFNEDGLLIGFDNRMELDRDAHINFLRILPKSSDALEELGVKYKDIAVKCVDITFVMFWEKWFQHREKDNSSKKRAEIKWNKMSKDARMKAYDYIYRYFYRLPVGVMPKYAETYLNSELWNN